MCPRLALPPDSYGSVQCWCVSPRGFPSFLRRTRIVVRRARTVACGAGVLSQARIPSARCAQKLFASAHLGAWRRRAAYGHLWGLHYTVFHVKKRFIGCFLFICLSALSWNKKVTKSKVSIFSVWIRAFRRAKVLWLIIKLVYDKS